MLPLIVSACILLLAALPALLIFRNMPLFQALQSGGSANDGEAPGKLQPLVSVLIPARDEASGIAEALESVLAGDYRHVELIVMDDHSTDSTAEIVEAIAKRDERVKLARAPELPSGWNGKQHACHQLATESTGEYLLFIDADVRLANDAISQLVTRIISTPEVQLLSGFPHQRTETWSEKLLIPMMHFVLLGYLPLDQMRRQPEPAFGAGCGQLFLARREGYFKAGGHAKICGSRHDGLKLPRSFRTAGFQTDLVDASTIANVRMYGNWLEVKAGVLKNANEGIARSPLIYVFSVLLLGAGVLPVLAFAHGLFWGWPTLANSMLGFSVFLSFASRAWIARCLRQSWLGVALHPIAVGLFVGLQWIAFIRTTAGYPAVAWRGRT